MSNLKTCNCDRVNYRVAHRNHNHSYFQYPQGQEHWSQYSGIVCIKCGWRFRTRAKWVLKCPDVTQEEDMRAGELTIPCNLGNWV